MTMLDDLLQFSLSSLREIVSKESIQSSSQVCSYTRYNTHIQLEKCMLDYSYIGKE